ncbi:uncharacterized protein O9250_010444 isoform 3-T3 [Rhynochetos jubatus]
MEREERRRKKCLNRQSLLAVPRERAAQQSSGRITEPVPAGWMTAECLELQRRKGGERETPEPPRSASISEGGSCDESRSLGAMPGPCPWAGSLSLWIDSPSLLLPSPAAEGLPGQAEREPSGR